jgi:hypothetical protein
LNAALVLQWITFGLNSFLIVWLFSKLFFRNLALEFMGNVITGTGIALTMLFPGAGSDYLFITFILTMTYLCDEYISSNRLRTIWLMVVVGALAMLQRYIGIALLLTAILIVYFYSRTGLRDRLKRVVYLGLSFIPVGVWVLSNSVSSLERSGPSSLFENIYWFTVSSLTWFFSYSTLLAHPFRLQVGLWTIWLLGIIFIFLFWTIRKRSIGNNTFVEIPILLFGLVYTIVLLAISSLSYFNRLDGRFVAPVFIPFIVLLLVVAEAILDAGFIKNTIPQAVGRVVVFISLLLILGLTAYQSILLVELFHVDGSGYTSREWYTNRTMEYWLQHQPEKEYLAFSNYPAGVAIHSWQETLSSPRRADPNSRAGVILYPLEDYIPFLFEAGKDTYLIWIEPNSFTHVYTVDELRKIAIVDVLYENADGGVYKLLPLK